MLTGKLLSICLWLILSLSSRSATVKGRYIMSGSARHEQTVDTRTIYHPYGQTQAADILPITPRHLFFSFFCAFAFRLQPPSFSTAFVRGRAHEWGKRALLHRAHCKQVSSYELLSLPASRIISVSVAQTPVTILIRLFPSQQRRPSDPYPFSPVINGNAIIGLNQQTA